MFKRLCKRHDRIGLKKGSKTCNITKWGGVFGDNEPEKVEITFSKVDDTFLDKFNKFLERAESRRERYDLTWNGKAAAFAEAGKPLDPAKTLRPDLGESVDFDKTQNLFITGDNLEALKLLQESYLNKVDMIYIDPPYNTGHDFIYHDNFHRSQSNEIDDSRDNDGNRQYTVNSKENGRYHSDWLSMMYPRLMIARNLLSENGVIFISIDDSEQANLKLLCDEVFGVDNFIGQLAWQKKTQPSFLSKKISSIKEYVLFYCKDFSADIRTVGGLTDANKHVEMINISNRMSERVLRSDNVLISNGAFTGRLSKGSYGDGALQVSLLNDVDVENGKPCDDIRLIGRFKWTQERMNESFESGDVFHIKSTKSLRPTVQRNSNEQNTKPILDLLSKISNPAIPTNTDATNELKSLFGGIAVMDYPKPSKLLLYLARAVTYTNRNATVLDFFAGSGTTAHAVMQLNAEDGGHRKFIMVQLPEECSEKSEAYKAGYKTIDQLSRERIRRAAKKIKESDKNADDHDYGFRALYIDKANAKNDISVPADSLQQSQLSFQVDDIYADRSPLDLLFGVLVAKGWQLDGEIERRNINGNDVYLYDYVPGAGMVACFNNNLTDEAVNQIIDMHPQVAVFRETAFKRSDEKINLMERFKNDSPETRVWVI